MLSRHCGARTAGRSVFVSSTNFFGRGYFLKVEEHDIIFLCGCGRATIHDGRKFFKKGAAHLGLTRLVRFLQWGYDVEEYEKMSDEDDENLHNGK